MASCSHLPGDGRATTGPVTTTALRAHLHRPEESQQWILKETQMKVKSLVPASSRLWRKPQKREKLKIVIR